MTTPHQPSRARRRRLRVVALAAACLVSAGTAVVGTRAPAALATEPAVPDVATLRLDVRVRDVIWDAARGVLYASVDATSPTYAGRLVTIDPYAGAVVSNRSVGTVPSSLAMTDDGSALYVGIDGRGAVQKFSLPGFTPGWSYTFGTGVGGQMVAEDIEVMPGTTNTIVVSRRRPGISPSHGGNVVIDSGVARPTTTPSHTGSNSIVFGADASTLYGSDTEISGREFQRHAIDANGITETDITNGLGGGTLLFHDGLVYESDGRIIDPTGATPTLADTLEGGSGFAIDAATDRVIYAERIPNGTPPARIRAFDLTSRQPAGEWGLPDHNGFVGPMVSMGDDLLAYIELSHPRIKGGNLVLVDLASTLAAGLGAFGEYTPLTPRRVLDTRTGLGRAGIQSPVGPGGSITVQIAGEGGIPATGVTTVVMNVTVTQPTAASFLTVWPTGIARPTISNLNYTPGQTVPNLVTVALGPGGSVSAFNQFGTTHVIFDVVGFYSDVDGPDGFRFQAIDPYRYFDTRTGAGGVPASPIGPNRSLRFDVLGKGGVPRSGVAAVAINVTVTGPTAPSFLTVYPGDVGSVPEASNLNFGPGDTVPNLVVVRVPTSGVVEFFNRFGTAHVIVDVVGYYDEDRTTEAGRLIPLVPNRSYDSRLEGGAFPPNFRFSLYYEDEAGRPETRIEAVVLNVTVTSPTAPSYLTVFPADVCGTPTASNLNFRAGQTIPNHVMVRLSRASGCARAPGGVALFNRFGSVHVIVDAFGGFTSESFSVERLTDGLGVAVPLGRWPSG